MNKNVTALILIVLAVGIYFTFTSAKLAELHDIRLVNASYQKALNNADNLIKIRDNILKEYNAIPADDIDDRLNKIIPDNVDNVRLIIDVKDDIARAHGLSLKDIKTDSPNTVTKSDKNQGENRVNVAESEIQASSKRYGEVTLSFSVTAPYQTFLNLLRDLESSLRLMDISSLSVAAGEDAGSYDFGVEIKTYWLK